MAAAAAAAACLLNRIDGAREAREDTATRAQYRRYLDVVCYHMLDDRNVRQGWGFDRTKRMREVIHQKIRVRYTNKLWRIRFLIKVRLTNRQDSTPFSIVCNFDIGSQILPMHAGEAAFARRQGKGKPSHSRKVGGVQQEHGVGFERYFAIIDRDINFLKGTCRPVHGIRWQKELPDEAALQF